jgi:cytosine/adenosine deaminase-related metal-dependent hydrolase
MGMVDIGAYETARWAIVDTLYFDSLRHRFVRGDIEIDDSRIARVLPPRTSRRACTLAGDATVCLPGLIDSDSAGPGQRDWNSYSRELAAHGVTTAGVFCRGLSECAAFAGAEGVRRLLYVELGESGGANGSAFASAPLIEGFVRVAASLGLARCEVFPAVVPGEIWSAATLLAAASIAETLGRRLCVRLSATHGDAKRYKETRFFTEVGLLSYLSLLSQVTIFNLSQLTRCDVGMLNDSAANVVCAPGAVSESLLEAHFARLSLRHRALGFSIGRHAVTEAERYESLVLLSMALIHQAGDATATCDVVVDALTRSAALALGIANIGAIAADMKADLCLFERPNDFADNGDSRDFIKLLASAKPRDVLIDGSPVVLDGAFVREPVQA